MPGCHSGCHNLESWGQQSFYLILNKRPRSPTFTPFLLLGEAGRLSHAAPRSQFSLLSTVCVRVFVWTCFPCLLSP